MNTRKNDQVTTVPNDRDQKFSKPGARNNDCKVSTPFFFCRPTQIKQSEFRCFPILPIDLVVR